MHRFFQIPLGWFVQVGPFTIECEQLEEIAMLANWRTRAAIAWVLPATGEGFSGLSC